MTRETVEGDTPAKEAISFNIMNLPPSFSYQDMRQPDIRQADGIQVAAVTDFVFPFP